MFGAAPSFSQETAQASLEITLNSGEEFLEFDWPMIEIGTGEYEAGPTGVTVIKFGKKVYSAIDVRGGGPSSVNAPYMELGYNLPELDAVVFAGGSWYGLEATTAIATAMLDDGEANGIAFGPEPTLAMSVGSIVYDLGGRRFNEIYPDKRLAQAAYRAAKTGKFAQGPHGGGRSTLIGSLLGCNAHGGQGGAYKKIGELKVAVFTVVNALGVVVDRDGKVVACYKGEDAPEPLMAKDFMADFPESRGDNWAGPETKNTTITLVVTNQTLSPQDLKRFAIQTHTSMARAIQPYSTAFDGDVLYAVSTAELDKPVMAPIDLGVVAGEVAWDAILNAVPEQPVAPAANQNLQLSRQVLDAYVGDYVFSDLVSVHVKRKGNKLVAKATGEREAMSIKKNKWVELQPVTQSSFTVPGRYPFVVSFEEKAMVINPGRWSQTGIRN